MSDLKRVAITVIRPKDYIHSNCFNPVLRCLEQALKAKKYEVDVLFNVYTDLFTNIVIGAHLSPNPLELSNIKNSIVYNFEQITNTSPWITKDYFKLLASKPYWDYSITNIDRAYEIDKNIKARHVPFAYEPILSYTYVARDVFRTKKYDIDVLFFGSMNDRRAKVLDTLKQRGLNVVSVFGVYEQDLSVLIKRSKVILNMHYYDSAIFEAVRVIPLLACGNAVVTEESVDDSSYAYLDRGIIKVPYHQLVDACQMLVDNDALREDTAEIGFSNVKRKTMNDSILKVEGML